MKKPWASFEDGRPNKKKKNKMSSDMRSDSDLKIRRVIIDSDKSINEVHEFTT